MLHFKSLRPARRLFAYCLAMFAVSLWGPVSRGQNATPPAPQKAAPSWSEELNKYPGLIPEFSRLVDKLQHDIQFPPPRTDSTLVPLLPPSTMSFAAFPNYGGVANQLLALLHQELQESSVFRDWWQHGQIAASGPKIEEALDKFSQLNQYLGDEIVFSGSTDGNDRNVLIVAEVRKPGLKNFLQQALAQIAGKSQSHVRILDLQELASAQDTKSSDELIVLVRPDYVVVSLNLATLRAFNTRLAGTNREFPSTPFGRRVLQEYQGGLTVLAAADLHTILSQLPASFRENASFQQSGFSDVKYVVWDHKRLDGQDVSQSELSFNNPRHSAASWLANSRPLTTLDFVSPKSMVSATIVLSSLSQIFDDAKILSGPSNAGTFVMLPQFEKSLNLSLKDDLLNLLDGEITIEVNSLGQQQPVWKAILGVKDSDHLQQTFSKLLATTKFEAEPFEQDGVTYHTVRVPQGKSTLDIGYAFVDGHLLIGSSRDVVADGVRLHRSAGSLAKSAKFLTALPPGHSLEASALLYEDAAAVGALQLRQFDPTIAHSLSQNSTDAPPVVVGLYGGDKSIREASTSPSFDAASVLIVAAVAVPNLLRSRIAANEASALGSLRTVNTAEITYSAAYPKRGFAPNLSTLGVDPRGTTEVSQDHAGLLAETLVNSGCTADGWCTKEGYRFIISALCKLRLCSEYMAVATPVSDSTGTRSFCTTSDGVIRFKPGSPLAAAPTAAQCKTWAPIR
jgi:type II secretory pathway pseudopilin PulG